MIYILPFYSTVLKIIVKELSWYNYLVLKFLKIINKYHLLIHVAFYLVGKYYVYFLTPVLSLVTFNLHQISLPLKFTLYFSNIFIILPFDFHKYLHFFCIIIIMHSCIPVISSLFYTFI